ncbi:hypothetical protein BH10PSE1_BH10PSE1_18080 [soil metagenome]
MTPSEAVGMTGSGEHERLLSRKEAAAFLATLGVNLKVATLARLWSTGDRGPPCRHIRSRPYYPQDALRTWGLSQISELRTGAPKAARGRRHE